MSDWKNLLAGVGAVAVIVYSAVSWAGCVPAKQGQQLADRLAGEWVSKDDETVTAYFTNGSKKLVFSFVERVKLPMQSRLAPPTYTGEERKNSQTYEIQSFGQNSITLKKNGLGTVVIDFEFASDDEFVAIYKCEWDTPPKMSGRFRRAVARVPKPEPVAGPIEVAKKQVDGIEQKLKRMEALRDDAAKERDDLIAKLREFGVDSVAELKRNARALRMAENLAKLTAEIEGMDSHLATIDTELLKAKSIARRMQQEQTSLSDDEMRRLSVQLREAEARTDAPSRPITPLDVDVAVDAALKSRKTSPGGRP